MTEVSLCYVTATLTLRVHQPSPTGDTTVQIKTFQLEDVAYSMDQPYTSKFDGVDVVHRRLGRAHIALQGSLVPQKGDHRMEVKVKTVKKCSATLTEGELVAALRRVYPQLPREVTLSVRVPGGGDWSDTDLVLGQDTDLQLEWVGSSEEEAK